MLKSGNFFLLLCIVGLSFNYAYSMRRVVSRVLTSPKLAHVMISSRLAPITIIASRKFKPVGAPVSCFTVPNYALLNLSRSLSCSTQTSNLCPNSSRCVKSTVQKGSDRIDYSPVVQVSSEETIKAFCKMTEDSYFRSPLDLAHKFVDDLRLIHMIEKLSLAEKFGGKSVRLSEIVKVINEELYSYLQEVPTQSLLYKIAEAENLKWKIINFITIAYADESVRAAFPHKMLIEYIKRKDHVYRDDNNDVLPKN